METAGHECVGHIEIDKYANMSYAAMHKPKEGEFFGTDIRTVEPGDLPDADIYCGGFPCQAFSIAGKRGGFEDMRGTLIFEVFRLAAERKPKILFLENVKGILNHDNGKTFGAIINAMGELGYDAEWQLFNSKNFGVPQNRERVFIIGHLGRYSGGEVFPIRGYDEKDNELQGQSDITNCITARYEGAQATGSYVVEGEQYAQGIKQVQNGRRFKIRRLTPRECFRLQGFPDEYFDRARAVNSDSQLYKQAGNSVTVNVIYEIAKRLETKQ
jgi:DNA (cytosine-5)-methyltransferase 1